MLAIKKKREAEAKAKAEAEAAAAAVAATTDGESNAPTTSMDKGDSSAMAIDPPTNTATAQPTKEKVSLLGIGGKKKQSPAATDGTTSKAAVKKRTPGELRIQKDIAELDGGTVATIKFPNVNDLTNFDVSICPDSGYWKNATYHFQFTIPSHYPHSPPKVECKTKIYHPNIDLQGKVCLNILREDWKPVLDINSVIYGLIYLFYEPNPDDPLNHEAAELFRKDVKDFERLVNRTLKGGYMDGTTFEKLV